MGHAPFSIKCQVINKPRHIGLIVTWALDFDWVIPAVVLVPHSNHSTNTLAWHKKDNSTVKLIQIPLHFLVEADRFVINFQKDQAFGGGAKVWVKILWYPPPQMRTEDRGKQHCINTRFLERKEIQFEAAR